MNETASIFNEPRSSDLISREDIPAADGRDADASYRMHRPSFGFREAGCGEACFARNLVNRQSRVVFSRFAVRGSRLAAFPQFAPSDVCGSDRLDFVVSSATDAESGYILIPLPTPQIVEARRWGVSAGEEDAPAGRLFDGIRFSGNGDVLRRPQSDSAPCRADVFRRSRFGKARNPGEEFRQSIAALRRDVACHFSAGRTSPSRQSRRSATFRITQNPVGGFAFFFSRLPGAERP